MQNKNTSLPGDVHVVPLLDLRPHESSSECWCKPTPDEDDERVWLHHSLDNREAYEHLPPGKLN